MPTGKPAGFTYLGMLALLSVLLMWSTAATQWSHQQMRREQETELLFVGHQYRTAIWNVRIAMGRWPSGLQEMLNAVPGSEQPRRFLRRIYIDPITGKSQGGLVPAQTGGIQGVYSLSTLTPLKQTQFQPEDESFAGARKYSDWKFLASTTPVAAN